MQHMYSKAKSTDITLHKIVKCIENNVTNHKFSQAYFLDIERTFKNINSKINAN